MIENGVRVRIGEHEIIFEDETGLMGPRVGVYEMVQGGQMAQSTPKSPSSRSVDPGDTDQFVRRGVDTLHFFEELGPAIFTVIEIDIINDIDMGVPGGRDRDGGIRHGEKIGMWREGWGGQYFNILVL